MGPSKWIQITYAEYMRARSTRKPSTRQKTIVKLWDSLDLQFEDDKGEFYCPTIRRVGLSEKGQLALSVHGANGLQVYLSFGQISEGLLEALELSSVDELWSRLEPPHKSPTP
jgi:hypothetical protein